MTTTQNLARKPAANPAPRAVSLNGTHATNVADAPDASPTTLIERTYFQLRDDILEGRLAPGEKLRIQHLSKDYGVGAGTLREALTRLVSDVLVVAEGQRGFRVSPMTLDDLQDLTDLRVHIEIEALRRSIRNGTALWREQVTAAFTALSAIEQPIDPAQSKRWEALNRSFHEALIDGYDSSWTHTLLRVLYHHSERYRQLAIKLRFTPRDVHAEHLEIYEHALSGNELRAALALEAHIRTTLDILKQAEREGIELFGPKRLASSRNV